MFINRFAKTDFSSYEDYYNNFEINVPENFNFAYDVLDELAKIKPNNRALVWCDDNDNEKVFTYANMALQVNKTANFFKSLGIKRGDFVMVILKRHYEFWFTILALHKIGAITIPATHLLTTHDIEYRTNAADIKVIIGCNDDYLINQVEGAMAKSPSVELKILVHGKRDGWISFEDGISDQPTEFARQETSNKDLMLVYFTSGTTGFPKMVAHNFEYPLAHIATSFFWQNCQVDGLHLTVADTGWAKAMWGKLYGQWLCESAIFVYDMDKFVAKTLIEKLVKYKVTSFCVPPTMYRFMIQEDLSKYDWSFLKHASVAGEPLNPEVYNKFLELTGLKLYEGFGQTELVVTLANFPWFEPRPGSMGKPVALYDIDLLNHEGKSCDAGEEGELVIRTDKKYPRGIFNGYYRDENLTNSTWQNNIYHTGDLAWRDEDGFFWYVGRADDVIKSSGYRIGPFEVESVLMEHPAVLETAITGVLDEMRGAVVKATIVLAKGYEPTEDLKKELQEYVKKNTAPYKYPRIIEFVDVLPKTISGKIRRVEIRNNDK